MNEEIPSKIVEMLTQKAVDNNSLGSIGEALQKVQENIDAVFDTWRQNASQTAVLLQQTQMRIEVIECAVLSLVDVLIDNNLMTEEKWDKIQEENSEKLRTLYEEARQRHQEAVAEAQKAAEEEEEEEEENEEEEEEKEIDSDVVLPSEKDDAVVRFPNKKDE